MKQMTIRETRAAIGRIDELVEAHGEIVVTRHGRPLARIVTMQPHHRAVPSNEELRASLPFMERASEHLVRDDRDGVR